MKYNKPMNGNTFGSMFIYDEMIEVWRRKWRSVIKEIGKILRG